MPYGKDIELSHASGRATERCACVSYTPWSDTLRLWFRLPGCEYTVELTRAEFRALAAEAEDAFAFGDKLKAKEAME